MEPRSIGRASGSQTYHGSGQAATEWLRGLSTVDWQAAGLPAFEDWDPALSAVAILMARSPSPMAMMIGPKGILLANHRAQDLLAATTGAVNGLSVFDVLPDSA